MPSASEFLTHLYADFNLREMESVLRALHPNVKWANGMDGGFVYGREAVRDYWTRQWSMINPRVDPTNFQTDAGGRVVVDVHQVVRDLDGNILFDGQVQHAYTLIDGLVRSMEILEPTE